MPNPKLETYKHKATGTVYDLTDAAAQTALSGILDGTDIDSFDDVETALEGKADTSDIPDITGKADKVASATNGNFAGLNASGNLTDSGKKASDFASSSIMDGTSIDSFGDVETALAGKSDISIVAPEFSTSMAYTIDQYVTYEGKLYRFKNNHSAGAWNIGQVYEVTVGHDLEHKQNITGFSGEDFIIITHGQTGQDYETYSVELNKADAPAENSVKPITSGAVYDALQNKLDWSSYAKTGVHNVLPYLSSGAKTVGGTTFTITDYGTVVVNSNAASEDDLYYIGSQNSAVESAYSYWGIPVACRMTVSCKGLVSGLSLFIVKWAGSSSSVVANITSASQKASFDYSPTTKYRIALRKANGSTISNTTVEPLVKLESDTSDDISKPAMTNFQLSQRTDIIVTQPTAPDYIASHITYDPMSGIARQGNIVTFRIRFTLDTDMANEFPIANLGYLPVLAYPMFIISDRNAPYGPVRGAYLSNVINETTNENVPIKTDGGTLTAGTYDVWGMYICKD